MIRAHRINATAQDDATMVAGWNIAPNVAYTLRLLPGPASCGVLLYDAHDALIATGAALAGTDQPCILTPQAGQSIEMLDADIGWHLLLTTAGTESQREIRINPAVDLPDEIHPIYGDDDMALARATAAIDGAAHYIDDVTVTCPLGIGAGLGDVVSVPVDGVVVGGQVEAITWTGTPDGATEQAVIRRHAAIAPEVYVEPTPITPPTVADDTGETDAATITSGNVLTNDEAGLAVVAINGLSASVGVAVDGNNGGTFTITSNGAWTFDPDGDFDLLTGSETADTSVTYYASDGVGEAMGTLTVTVSSGAATYWTPAEISGAIVFDALDSVNITLNGSTVSAWADMLGSGITATQTNAANQPTMGDGEVVFANDFLTITNSKSASWCKKLHSDEGWFFIVAQPGISENPNSIYAFCGSNEVSGGKIGITVYYDDRSSVSANNRIGVIAGNLSCIVHLNNNTSAFGGQYSMLDVLVDPNNTTKNNRSFISINGGQDLDGNTGTGSVNTGNAAYDMQIGACGNNAFPLTGKMRCIMFYPGTPTTEQRLKMQGWAAHRHGATSLLPSDHPYKSAPPTI